MGGGGPENVKTGPEVMALRFAAALDARHRARGLRHFADRLNLLERYTDGEPAGTGHNPLTQAHYMSLLSGGQNSFITTHARVS